MKMRDAVENIINGCKLRTSQRFCTFEMYHVKIIKIDSTFQKRRPGEILSI